MPRTDARTRAALPAFACRYLENQSAERILFGVEHGANQATQRRNGDNRVRDSVCTNG